MSSRCTWHRVRYKWPRYAKDSADWWATGEAIRLQTERKESFRKGQNLLLLFCSFFVQNSSRKIKNRQISNFWFWTLNLVKTTCQVDLACVTSGSGRHKWGDLNMKWNSDLPNSTWGEGSYRPALTTLPTSTPRSPIIGQCFEFVKFPTRYEWSNIRRPVQ